MVLDVCKHTLYVFRFFAETFCGSLIEVYQDFDWVFLYRIFTLSCNTIKIPFGCFKSSLQVKANWKYEFVCHLCLVLCLKNLFCYVSIWIFCNFAPKKNFMTSLIILFILLLFVGIIGYSVLRRRKSTARPLLAKTRSFDHSSEAEPIESTSTTSDLPHNSCALATTLRIIGVVNVLAALIIGIVLADDFSWGISTAVILSGGLGCLFCYALAKCVDAADKYLNSH